MYDPACTQLDGYLGKWLGDRERADFAVHLQHCCSCREAVEEQEQLDRLLVRATTELGPTPHSLSRQIEQTLCRARRRHRALWIGAVAATLLLALGIVGWLIQKRSEDGGPSPPIVQRLPQTDLPNLPDPRSLVQVTFPRASEVIDVPIETSSPNVTLIWLYPAVPVAPRPAGRADSSLFPERSSP